MKKLTPRQRAAINQPCRKTEDAVHVRYHRVNGYFQSILTFDLFASVLPYIESDHEWFNHIDAGKLGLWHARVATFPVSNPVEWDQSQQRSCGRRIKQLISRVGIDEIEIQVSMKDGAIHGWRWGTSEELAAATRLNGVKKANTNPEEN